MYPGVADVSMPILGYCSLKELPFAISAGRGFPYTWVTARRSAPILGYCSSKGLPFAISAGQVFPYTRVLWT